MMRLHVEDELLLGPFLREGVLVLHLVGRDLIDGTEDLVERHQGGRHAAAGAQECTPAQTLTVSRLLAEDGQAVFVLFLLRRLWRRDKLLVGSDARRNGRRSLRLRVEIALAYPHEEVPPVSTG